MGALAGLLGFVTALGVILIVLGYTSPFEGSGRKARDRKTDLSGAFKSKGSSTGTDIIKLFRESRTHQLKLFLSIFLGFIFYVTTGWPVAGMFAIFVGWALPDLSTTFSSGRKIIGQVEAYETWTSQLQHLISAGNHIVDAIVISQPRAPESIRENVGELVAQIEIVGLTPALDNFAEISSSPYADQVVLGLKVAYEGGTKVAEVLEDLTDVFRREVEILKKAESSRQLANTQILLSISVSFLLIMLLVVINRGYLDPFNEFLGQVVLAMIAGLFIGAITIVKKRGIVDVRPRIIVDQAYLDEDKEYQKGLRLKEKEEKKLAKKASKSELLEPVEGTESQ